MDSNVYIKINSLPLSFSICVSVSVASLRFFGAEHFLEYFDDAILKFGRRGGGEGENI